MHFGQGHGLKAAVEKAIALVRSRLKVAGLKAALKAGGGRVYGNKPDLIPRLVALLEHQFEFSPDGATLQEILSEVSNANGGTLEYYGYQRSSPLRPYAPTTTLGTLAGMKPQKVAMVPRANPPAYGAPGSSGQHPQGPPKPASKPFEGLSYSQSPFHAFHSRLYTKVVDGRSGHISITDFVMIEKHVSLILEKREGQQGQRKYGVKVYMGNPQMMSPFGDRKMIEPSFSDSCFVTVNGKAVDASVCISVPLLVFKNENSRKATKKKIIPLKKKIWACVPPDITDYLILKAGAQNRLELRFGYMYPKAVVTLELVELVSVDDRVNLVCTNSKLTKESILDERQKKVAKAAVADDDDIEATSEVICFRDPILQTRISKPGRSKKCKHTQCFDLPTFFMMNSATPTYTCAVCNSKIKWEDVVLDGFFDDILTSVGEDVDSIEIQPDGTWALPVKTEDVSRQSSSTSRPDKRKRYPEVVCLDEDDEENAEEDDEDRPLAKRRTPLTQVYPEQDPNVIDLTISDDDDCAAPPAANPMSSPVIIPSRQPHAHSATVTQSAPAQMQPVPSRVALPQPTNAPPAVTLPGNATAPPPVALPPSTMAPPPVAQPVAIAPQAERRNPISITLTLPETPTAPAAVLASSNQRPKTTAHPLSVSYITATEMQDAQEAQEALVRELEQSLADFPSGSSTSASGTGRIRAGSDVPLTRNPSSAAVGRARSLSDVPAPRPIDQLCPPPVPQEDDIDYEDIPSPTSSIMKAMEQAAVAAESLLSEPDSIDTIEQVAGSDNTDYGRLDPGSVELTPSPRGESPEVDPITGFSVPQPPFPTNFANKSGSSSVRTDLDPQRGLVTSIVNSMRDKSRSEVQQRRYSSEMGRSHPNSEIRSTNGTVRAWMGSAFHSDPSVCQSPQFPHGL